MSDETSKDSPSEDIEVAFDDDAGAAGEPALAAKPASPASPKGTPPAGTPKPKKPPPLRSKPSGAAPLSPFPRPSARPPPPPKADEAEAKDGAKNGDAAGPSDKLGDGAPAKPLIPVVPVPQLVTPKPVETEASVVPDVVLSEEHKDTLIAGGGVDAAAAYVPPTELPKRTRTRTLDVEKVRIDPRVDPRTADKNLAPEKVEGRSKEDTSPGFRGSNGAAAALGESRWAKDAPVGIDKNALPSASFSNIEPIASEPPPRPPTRSPLLVGVIGGAGVGAVILGLWLTFGRGGEPAATTAAPTAPTSTAAAAAPPASAPDTQASAAPAAEASAAAAEPSAEPTAAPSEPAASAEPAAAEPPAPQGGRHTTAAPAPASPKPKSGPWKKQPAPATEKKYSPSSI